MRSTLTISILALLVLSACASRGGLHDFRLKPGEGPDAFKVTTQKPLEQPENYKNLPQPGAGPNKADTNPKQEAITALGGSQSAGGIPSSDAALVRHTSRYGVNQDIRRELDVEDEKFRKRRGTFGVLRRGDKYFAAYSSMALDAWSEHERFRKAGITVPTAPPR